MKKSKGENIFNVFNIIFMILFSIVTIYPYLNQVAVSFNDGMDSMRGGIILWPRVFTLANYKAVFSNTDVIYAALISASRVVLYSALSLMIVYACAYGLTRKGIPFRKQITLFLMIPAYISPGIIPIYILYRYYGLINNYLVYILPSAFVFYNMVILRSFLQELPASIEESAKMDGANDIVVMFKIIFPLSLPVVATVSLWNAVGSWNDWTTTLMYITDKKLFSLQYVMMRLIKESEIAQQMAIQASMTGTGSTYVSPPTSEAIKSATLIVSTIPIIIVYPFLQKYFIQGVTLGAVKE